MTTIDKKKDMNKKQEDKDTREDQIEETLENASDTVVAESKNEASQIGDSDRE
jgi:hypothetical protein